MTFTSLIFDKKTNKKVMDKEIIEDLKLNLLLSEEVSDMLLYEPNIDNILIRQNMFSLLLKDEKSLDKIEKMTSVLRRCHEKYIKINNSGSEYAASYVFAFLFADLYDFYYEASSDLLYGDRFVSFSNIFKELSNDERIKNAVLVAKDIINEFKLQDSFYLLTDSELTKVIGERDRNITSSLINCANELGIELSENENLDTFLQPAIADALAKIRPEIFDKAKAFYHENRDLVYGAIFEYIPELVFICGILKFTKKMIEYGLPYSFPKPVKDKKLVNLKNVYDFTLTVKNSAKIVPNDIIFDEKEPFYYLTGANGGGKTTYLRATGNALILFLAGAPTFCDGGEVFVFDSVLAHFPRDERFEGSGRFFDEIKRVEKMLSMQNGNSMILLNETYATTGEDKATEYTTELAEKLYNSGNFGLYITHQHGVSTTNIPFLGVMIDESDANRRTYRIEKRRLPPKSFAQDILEKYNLTKEALEKRFILN